MSGTKQHFNVPYKDKFNGGEFRKKSAIYVFW